MINENIKFPDNAVCFACGTFWFVNNLVTTEKLNTLMTKSHELETCEEIIKFDDFKLNIPAYNNTKQNKAIKYLEALIITKIDHPLDDSNLKAFKETIDNKNTEHFKDGSKYHKPLIGLCGTRVITDVYRVLDAYPTNSSSIDHAVKKLLNAGQRGHKDKITDYENAIESIEQAIQLEKQKLTLDKET